MENGKGRAAKKGGKETVAKGGKGAKGKKEAVATRKGKKSTTPGKSTVEKSEAGSGKKSKDLSYIMKRLK